MTKYKILLITALSKPWNNGWYYKSGLEKNGHKVISVDPFSISSVEAVIKLVKESPPDFILHTKDELPPEAFDELRNYARVIQWYPDLAIPEWLPRYVQACDIFFTIAEGLVEEFRKFNNNTFYLSQAFEPSFFETKMITAEDIDIFSADVTFVGSLGSKEYYMPRRGYLKWVLDEKFNFKWWGPRIPRKLSNIPLIMGKIGRSYGGRFIYLEDYAKVARLSKIFLAFDAMPHVRKSMSARMYTAVGCGAFYMCRHVDGIEEILEPGKEIVTFKTEQDMIDMIRYYLKNEGLRRNISEAGRKRILKEHTYDLRMKQMISKIEGVIE